MIRSAKHAMTVEGVGIRHTPGCSLGFACVGIADEVDTVSVDVFEDHRLRLAVGWGGGGFAAAAAAAAAAAILWSQT